MLGCLALACTIVLSGRKGPPRRSAFAAVSALGLSKVIFSLCNALKRHRDRRIEQENESASKITNLMAWNEALGALRKIVDTFSDGLSAPFTLKHMLLDAELLRRHHTFLYQECLGRERERSSSRDLLGLFRSFASCCCPEPAYLPIITPSEPF